MLICSSCLNRSSKISSFLLYLALPSSHLLIFPYFQINWTKHGAVPAGDHQGQGGPALPHTAAGKAGAGKSHSTLESQDSCFQSRVDKHRVLMLACDPCVPIDPSSLSFVVLGKQESLPLCPEA